MAAVRVPSASTRMAAFPAGYPEAQRGRTPPCWETEMAEGDLLSKWESFRSRAAVFGFNIVWVFDRSQVDPQFAPPGHGAGAGGGSVQGTPPAALCPTYRRAVVLGSGGKSFWEGFRAGIPGTLDFACNPLDRYTENQVDTLVSILRSSDPGAVAAYPFTHPRQIIPFHSLLGGIEAFSASPIGIAIDPVHGPWFAWRAVILTSMRFPVSRFPDRSPCSGCPAPCVKVCPVEAASQTGFRWQKCVQHRLSQAGCRTQCDAREACPVGTDSRYSREQSAYHYEASLWTARRWASGADAIKREPLPASGTIGSVFP